MPASNWIFYPDEFTIEDWQEAADIWSPNQFTLTRSKSYCTVSAIVDWSKLKPCIQYILGYSYATDSSGGYALKRVTPSFHPILTWLYATQISELRGLGPDGLDEPLYSDSLVPGKYTKFKITVVYECLPFRVKEDNQVTAEYQRYLEILPKPYTELVVVDQGSMIWAANASTPSFDGTVVGSNQVKARQAKTALDMIWHDVAWNFIADSFDIPTKLLAIQKKVNLTSFLGFPAGTLLCEDVVIDKGVMPVASEVFDDLLFQAKVTFKMIYFNPQQGTGETRQGWNLLPRYDRGYYYATSSLGYPLFESYEFANAFTSVNV